MYTGLTSSAILYVWIKIEYSCMLFYSLQHQELLFQRLGLSKDGENQQMTPNIQLQHVSNLLQATAEVEELQSCLEKSQEERFQLQAICRHLMFTLRGADGSAVQCSGESHGKKASSR